MGGDHRPARAAPSLRLAPTRTPGLQFPSASSGRAPGGPTEAGKVFLARGPRPRGAAAAGGVTGPRATSPRPFPPLPRSHPEGALTLRMPLASRARRGARGWSLGSAERARWDGAGRGSPGGAATEPAGTATRTARPGSSCSSLSLELGFDPGRSRFPGPRGPARPAGESCSRARGGCGSRV